MSSALRHEPFHDLVLLADTCSRGGCRSFESDSSEVRANHTVRLLEYAQQ